MNAKSTLAVFLSFLCASLYADTVSLKDGRKLEGSVVSYKNQAFQFTTPKGATNDYALSSLQRIEFKAGAEKGVGAELVHHSRGSLGGRVRELAGGNFLLVNGQGKTETVPAWLVTSARFSVAIPEPAAPAVGAADGKFEVLTHGARIELEKRLAPGKATMIDFYADWCGPCRQMAPVLEKIANSDPSVVLKKVDIVNWSSEVCQQYAIRSVPQIWFYNKEGKFVGKFAGGTSADFDQLLAQAKK